MVKMLAAEMCSLVSFVATSPNVFNTNQIQPYVAVLNSTHDISTSINQLKLDGMAIPTHNTHN